MNPLVPYCVQVWVLLEYLGLNYQTVTGFEESVSELGHPSFRLKFPAHTIPCIEHGDTVF